MRAIWTGAITFGLVNVPVKVYSATEDHDISLHQVHDKDGGRIKYQRRCEICGEIVSYDHIDKAFDDGDKTVVLTDDDFASLPAERSREIEVVEFVPSDQVDPIMFDRSYFLEPDSKSPKAYALLRKTLEQTDRTAIVHFALRQKTRLGALRVHGKALMLQSLLWDDEVREADFPALREATRVSAKELEMSSALVDSFASDFTPGNFSDEYQEELRKLIDAKLSEGETLDTSATLGEPEESDDDDGGAEVLDLMEALRKSVEKNRGSAAPSKGGSSKGGSAKGASKRDASPKDASSKDVSSESDSSSEAPATKKKTASGGK